MTPTIKILTAYIKSNKDMIKDYHKQLIDIVDVIEKNEYISAIEQMQSDNEDYIKSIEILKKMEE